MEVLSLETIGAMQDTADRYAKNAANTRQLIEAQDKRIKDTSFGQRPEWERDAAVFQKVADELRTLVNKAREKRSYGTARWLTNKDSGLPLASVNSIIAAIQATPAVLEHRVSSVNPESNETFWWNIRLVHYYDPTTQENRWAVEHTDKSGGLGASDNESRSDAEFRYWQIARPMGAVKA